MKGKVSQCDHREYGFAQLKVQKLGAGSSVDALFEGLGDEMQVKRTLRIQIITDNGLMQVWMSHGDQLSEMPADFHVIGSTATAPYAAIAHNSKPFYGIQFHAEVTHSKKGREVIGRFVLSICGCKTNWTMVYLLLIYHVPFRV